MIKLITILLAFGAAAQAQTYNITGNLNGLPGGDYQVVGTATLGANGTYTISGNLTPAQQCVTITAPNGNLTDASGIVWSWGPLTGSGNNWQVMRDRQATFWSGTTDFVAAVAMSLKDGIVYNRHFSGEWRRWTSQGWIQQSGAPSGC